MNAFKGAFEFDDLLEEKVNYAFDEKRGYLTSCPTNVGTGMRASVMMHLPALAMTKQLNRMVPAINQLGLVVRGIYGEGSETIRSEEHTSELQSRFDLVCRLLLEKKKRQKQRIYMKSHRRD